MRILYFAWLRERIGVGSEEVAPPETVATVTDLVEWLKTREPRYAAAFEDTAAIRVALDQEQADFDASLSGVREVALFPPSPGAEPMSVRVQEADFDPGAELEALAAGDSDIGAVVSFTGLVRGTGGVETMTLEHYPGMTEKALAEMEAEARARWPLQASLIIHRVGPLPVGARIVFVATASRHRGAAFEAAEYLMDFLKTRAPFWKKEVAADGSAAWVDARESDDAAVARWG